MPDLPEPVADRETSHWLLGQVLARDDARVSWALADWLVVGKAFDPAFRKSAIVTGYSRPHLWNLYRVAVAFPSHRRSRKLALASHRELLREPDETRRLQFLAEAVQHEWTQSQIAAHLRLHSSDRPSSPGPNTHADGYQHVQVECPNCEHRFPVKGHKVKSAQ